MKVKIGIIGLGYVGLPLAVEFSNKYKTIGYDINKKRINELNKLNSINKDAQKLKEVFMPSNDREILKDISLPYVNRYSCLLSSLVNCYTSIKYEINTGIY